MRTIIMVYAYTQNADGSLNKQSLSRCKKALEVYRFVSVLLQKEKYIVLTCGCKQNGVMIADAMRDYFVNHGVSPSHILISPKGLNTAGETDACIELIHTRFAYKNYRIEAVSSWYHIPRICFLWHIRGYVIEGFSSFRGIVLKDLLLEPLKSVNSFLRPFASAKFSK